MGAPSSSGTPRPGSKYTNVEGPGKFVGHTKRLTESSGEVRSTNPPEAAKWRRGRQAPEIAPGWKESSPIK